MHWLVTAIVLTVGLSFICSLFEAVMLSTTMADIQALKRRHPRLGELLETMKQSVGQTISAILTLNTLANTLGSLLVGSIAAKLLNDTQLGILTAALTATILVISEVLPKILGVAYSKTLQPYVVYPLWWLRRLLLPVTYLSNLVVRPFIPATHDSHESDEEIILLAERGAQQGTLSKSESSIITNALALDD